MRRGFISDNSAISTAGLASPVSDSTADAKRCYRFDVSVLLSPSARERFPGVIFGLGIALKSDQPFSPLTDRCGGPAWPASVL
jgi:hypothetical protein